MDGWTDERMDIWMDEYNKSKQLQFESCFELVDD